MIHRLFCVGALFVGLVWCVGSGAAAAEKAAADLLPNSVAIYAEVPRPKMLLATILEHPLRQKLESFDDYRKAYETPQYKQFQTGVTIVEQLLGQKWRPALEALTDGGIYFAVDAKTQGTITLVKARDAATLEKFRDTMIQLARADAETKGKPDPIKAAEYRGIKAYRVEGGRFATVDNWLLITNKDEAGKAVLDAFLDGQPQPLAADEAFQAAKKSLAGQPTFWSFVRLNVLRDAGLAKELFRGKTDNPVAELLVGGIAATLQTTPYVTASLDASLDRLALNIAVPFDAPALGKSRSFYFGANGQSPAPPLLTDPETLLSLSTYRDLAGLWAAAADLFDERVNAQLAQTNTGLTTLFSGRDFGSDILGSVRPEMQLVVARQTFADDVPTPAIKLPATAIVFRLKDPAKMQRQWKVTFQSVIGFLNIVGAMQGQPQLEMDNEKVDGVQLVTGKYLPKNGDTPDRAAGINYNLSPTAAFVNDLFVVATSRQLALDLAKGTHPPAVDLQPGKTNTQLVISAGPLRKAFADNVAHLVSRNMLEKGHDKAQAEKEVQTFLDLLEMVWSTSLRLATDQKTLRLELGLDMAVGG